MCNTGPTCIQHIPIAPYCTHSHSHNHFNVFIGILAVECHRTSRQYKCDYLQVATNFVVRKTHHRAFEMRCGHDYEVEFKPKAIELGVAQQQQQLWLVRFFFQLVLMEETRIWNGEDVEYGLTVLCLCGSKCSIFSVSAIEAMCKSIQCCSPLFCCCCCYQRVLINVNTNTWPNTIIT